GCNDILAGGEQIEDGLSRPAGAADQLDSDMDLGVLRTWRRSVVISSRGTPGRGFDRSRTTTRRSTSGRAARAASRPGCSRSNFATPLPTVPQPTRAI